MTVHIKFMNYCSSSEWCAVVVVVFIYNLMVDYENFDRDNVRCFNRTSFNVEHFAYLTNLSIPVEITSKCSIGLALESIVESYIQDR